MQQFVLIQPVLRVYQIRYGWMREEVNEFFPHKLKFDWIFLFKVLMINNFSEVEHNAAESLQNGGEKHEFVEEPPLLSSTKYGIFHQVSTSFYPLYFSLEHLEQNIEFCS